MALALALLAQQNVAADDAPMSATVNITGRGGFDPPNVFIQRGGTVTWNNVDNDSHDVESESAPLQFVLSMSPHQVKSWRFVRSGVYHYVAGTDCIWGEKRLFPCIDNTVIVLDPGQSVPTPANITPTVTQAPTSVTVVFNASLQITDSGFVPKVAAVGLGGTAAWINAGTNQHTATLVKGPPDVLFDTGGLNTGQSNSAWLTAAGLYSYSSSTDCLHGVTSTTFDCSPAFLIVTDAPVGTSLPIPPQVLATFPATPTPITGVQPASDTNIVVDDVNGFSPRNLTIKLGQGVTWTNKGARAHSVVSNVGINPSFNLGGFGPAGTVSLTPLETGVYWYHSTADDFGKLDPSCNCNIYSGSITVSK